MNSEKPKELEQLSEELKNNVKQLSKHINISSERALNESNNAKKIEAFLNSAKNSESNQYKLLEKIKKANELASAVNGTISDNVNSITLPTRINEAKTAFDEININTDVPKSITSVIDRIKELLNKLKNIVENEKQQKNSSSTTSSISSIEEKTNLSKPVQTNIGATTNAKNYEKTKKDIIEKKKKEKEELTYEYNILQSTFSEMTFSDEITKCYEQSRLNEFKDKIALIDKEIEIIETGAFLDIFGDKYYSDIILSTTSNSDYLGIQSLNQFLKNYNIQSKFKDNITAIIAAFSAHFKHGNTEPRVCDSNMRIIYSHLRYRHRVLQTQRELFGLSPTGHHYASIAEHLDNFLQSVVCSGGLSMNSSNSKGKAPGSGSIGLSAGPLTNIATSLRTIASKLESGSVIKTTSGSQKKPGFLNKVFGRSRSNSPSSSPSSRPSSSATNNNNANELQGTSEFIPISNTPKTPEEEQKLVEQTKINQGYKGIKGAYSWLKNKLFKNKEVKQEVENTKTQLENPSNSSETNQVLQNKLKELQKELDNSKKEIAKIYKNIKQQNNFLKKHLVLSHIFKSFGNTDELNKLQKEYSRLEENYTKTNIEKQQLYLAKKTQNITIQGLEKEKKSLLQQKEALEKQIETLSKKSNKTPQDKLVLKKLLVILHVQNVLQSLQENLQKDMYEGKIQNMSTQYENEKAKLMNELSDLTANFNNKNRLLEETKNKLSTYIQKEREYINKLKKQVVIVYLLEKLQIDNSTVITVKNELNEDIRKYKQELDEERNKYSEEINTLKENTKTALNEQKIKSQEDIHKVKSALKKQLVIQHIYSKLIGSTISEQSAKILELENKLQEKEEYYIQMQDEFEKEYDENAGREISNLIEINDLITQVTSSKIQELKQTIDTVNQELKNYKQMSSAVYGILNNVDNNINIDEDENEEDIENETEVLPGQNTRNMFGHNNVFQEVERPTANVPSSETATPPIIPPITAENTSIEEKLNYSKISDIPIIKKALDNIILNKEKYQKYNMKGITPNVISDIRNFFGRENKVLTNENINNIIVKLQDIFQYGVNYGGSMTKSDILNMLLLLENYGRKQNPPYSIIQGSSKEGSKNTVNIGDNFYEFIKYIKESNEYSDENDSLAGSILLEKIEELHPILAEVSSGPKRRKVAPPSIPSIPSISSINNLTLFNNSDNNLTTLSTPSNGITTNLGVILKKNTLKNR